MRGFFDMVLNVNVTLKSFDIKVIPDDVMCKLLGGKGLKIEGPEYETVYAFGGLCKVKDIEEIMYLNDLCDRLGMDTISAGILAAFAIEAVRRGRIDLDIDYGAVDAIARLLDGKSRM